MKLQGCSAVVTGAGGDKSIGYEVAKSLLVDHGARCVCVVDVHPGRLQSCLSGLEAALGTALFTQKVSGHLCDVSDRDSCFKLCDEVLERWSRIDLFFANAGIAHSNSLIDSTWQDIDRVLGVNLHGVINCTKIFLPHLAKNENAALVTTSSLEGIMAMPGNVLYCTSKFAVKGFTEALMLDNKLLLPNVHVSVVHPGFVKTGLIENNKEMIRTNTLTPEQDPLAVDSVARIFQAMGSTTPRSAAIQILDGVRRGKRRILVGNDSVVLDFFVRLLPQLFYRRLVFFPVLFSVLFLVRTIGRKSVAAILLLMVFVNNKRRVTN